MLYTNAPVLWWLIPLLWVVGLGYGGVSMLRLARAATGRAARIVWIMLGVLFFFMLATYVILWVGMSSSEWML